MIGLAQRWKFCANPGDDEVWLDASGGPDGLSQSQHFVGTREQASAEGDRRAEAYEKATGRIVEVLSTHRIPSAAFLSVSADNIASVGRFGENLGECGRVEIHQSGLIVLAVEVTGPHGTREAAAVRFTDKPGHAHTRAALINLALAMDRDNASA